MTELTPRAKALMDRVEAQQATRMKRSTPKSKLTQEDIDKAGEIMQRLCDIRLDEK